MGEGHRTVPFLSQRCAGGGKSWEVAEPIPGPQNVQEKVVELLETT